MRNINNKTKFVIIIGILVAVTVIIITLVMSTVGKPSRKLRKQLIIANELLENHEYDKAVAEFKKALDIDPTCSDVYMGMADAFKGIITEALENDDYNLANVTLGEALEMLSKGYELTKDDRINEYIEELKKLVSSSEDDAEVLDVTDDKAENIKEEDELVPLSIRKLVEAPTLRGVCWTEYDGIQDMRAAFPEMVQQEISIGSLLTYLEWWPEELSRNDFLVGYSEQDNDIKSFSVKTNYHFMKDGSLYLASNIDFDYAYTGNNGENLTCDYMEGCNSTEYANGWYEYMEQNDYHSATDVIAGLGVDFAELNKEAVITIDTEYGTLNLFKRVCENGYCYQLSSTEGHNFSMQIMDKVSSVSGNNIVELCFFTRPILIKEIL